MKNILILIIFFMAVSIKAQFKEFVTPDVTIADADSISSVFDLGNYKLAGIITPAGVEGTLTFQTTNDTTGGVWYTIGDDSGTYTITPVDNYFTVFRPVLWYAFLRYGRILSSVKQTGAATIKVVKTTY